MDVVRPYESKKEGQEIASTNFQSIEKVGDFLWLGTYANGLYIFNTEDGTYETWNTDNSFLSSYWDGFETDWNYVGNNAQATYNNLNPGEYVLRIKSSNSDGVWNTNETKLVVLVTLLFGLLVVSIFSY